MGDDDKLHIRDFKVIFLLKSLFKRQKPPYGFILAYFRENFTLQGYNILKVFAHNLERQFVILFICKSSSHLLALPQLQYTSYSYMVEQ